MSNKVNVYKQKTKKYFNKISANYYDTWDGKYSLSMYEGVLNKIHKQPFKSILDVGCGTGAILSTVISEYKDIQACGIDLSEKMLEKAVELLGKNVKLVVGDSDSLPWDDDSFDLVICNASFHHYPEPLKVLMEMRRILKSNGRLIIADPWWSNPKRFLINIFLDSPFNVGGDVRIYAEQEICKLLAECEFKLIEWETHAKKYSIATAKAGK
jgi:ubiquinone/menaquinone biosynthesis C-methylase UbiE